ncbi:MAG: hypothetical protein HY341_00360 [Candidatus Kerfeldbacteria bacterium]|nr:hypothetical protein [Candidatus Kerfeldbacteria bacterium]
MIRPPSVFLAIRRRAGSRLHVVPLVLVLAYLLFTLWFLYTGVYQVITNPLPSDVSVAEQQKNRINTAQLGDLEDRRSQKLEFSLPTDRGENPFAP